MLEAVVDGRFWVLPHHDEAFDAAQKRFGEISARQPPTTPTLRIALRGWVGFLEGASLDWLQHGDIAKERLLADSIPGTIRVATRAGDR